MALGLLIDTDVLIDYLREQPEAVDFLEDQEQPLFISAITVGELYAGLREGRERAALAGFLRGFEVIPVNDLIAQQGGLFCRDYRKSHGLNLADALIPATDEANNLDLITLNRKHFPMISDLVVPYRKSE